MAVLTVQTTDESGLNATYSACAAGGDTFQNTGKEFIHVKNASAGSPASIDVTVTAQNVSKQVSGYGAMTKSDIVYTIPAGEEHFLGPFPTKAFNNSTGAVELSYSDVTSITIAVIKAVDVY